MIASFVCNLAANRHLLQGGGGRGGGGGGAGGAVSPGAGGGPGEGGDGDGFSIVGLVIFLSVIYGLPCLSYFCMWIVFTISNKCCTKKKKKKNNEYEYVHNSKHVKKTDCDPFVDGQYSGYYKQYGKNYPMKNFRLQFEDNIVTGNGSDKVGDYNLKGVYSIKTQRMILDKTYIAGTGDRDQNLGHTVKIRLEYNLQKDEFKGDWHVKTHKYVGHGDMWWHKDQEL